MLQFCLREILFISNEFATANTGRLEENVMQTQMFSMIVTLKIAPFVYKIHLTTATTALSRFNQNHSLSITLTKVLLAKLN